METKSLQNLEQGLEDSLKRKSDSNDEREAKVIKESMLETMSPVNREAVAFAKQPSTYQAVNKGNLKCEPVANIERNKSIDVVTKHGTKGTEIDLLANYFCLLMKPTWKIYRYHVTIKPEVEMRQKRILLLYQLKSNLGAFIYDGMQLFTTTKLEEKLMSYETKSQESESYMITLKEIGILEMDHKQSIQMLNLIMKRYLQVLNLQQIQYNYFNPKVKIDLREYSLQMWPGYSINRHHKRQKEEFVFMQTKRKIIRKQTVYDILQNCIRNSKDYREEFRSKIVGMMIYTSYNNRTYLVNDVDFEQTPRDTFKKGNTTVSFLHYYYHNYNLRIRDCNQPLLVSIKKPWLIDEEQMISFRLIPELCSPTGLSHDIISNVVIMRAIAGYTQINPRGYTERFIKFNKRLKGSENSARLLNNWNTTLDNKTFQINDRIIDLQRITLQHRNKISTDGMAKWSNIFKNYGTYWTPSGGLHRWAVIICAEVATQFRDFIEAIRKVGRYINMPIALPREIIISDSQNLSYVRAMEECFYHDPQLVMCVVPNSRIGRYAHIKKKSYVDRAVPTQIVILRRAINRATYSTHANQVVLQMNSKLGFAPWMIDMPLSGLMTIGYYTCDHITPDKNLSALVATMDLKENPTFFSTAVENTSNQKHADQVWHMMAKALHQYATEHGNLPYRILFYNWEKNVMDTDDSFYRDDVSSIVDRLQSEYIRYKAEKPPKFAYLIATDRVKSRLFDGSDNPPASTVIDDEITKKGQFHFFVISQVIRNASICPVSYYILYNTLGLTVDQLQTLTYKMCNLDYSGMDNNRIPAVCHYAKKLIFLIGNTLNKTSSLAMQKTLYSL